MCGLHELGPMSASPGGQLKLIVLPSFGKISSESSTLGRLGTESFVDNNCNSGCPQLARKTITLVPYVPQLFSQGDILIRAITYKAK